MPSYSQTPLTFDGGHLVEGTATAPKWSWHAHIFAQYLYDIGLASGSSQVRGGLNLGLGLPAGLEVALAMPMGWTAGVKHVRAIDPSPRDFHGMGEQGPAIGDLQAALLWSAFDSGKGGLGLLLGAKAGAPTGNHERLMGEGGFSVEPFVALAFQLFGTRLSLNLGYRIRPEHVYHGANGRFEQDDELIWRTGLRIPRKYDVAWSVEAEGTIGMATREGPWPSSKSRPVWIGVGVDFPVSRLYRLGLFTGGTLVGETAPTFSAGLTFAWLPVLPDEDKDGVGGISDECPLLKEDMDGYLDGDGCPDPDNDRDGFPDDEDQCPQSPGSDFSEDGC